MGLRFWSRIALLLAVAVAGCKQAAQQQATTAATTSASIPDEIVIGEYGSMSGSEATFGRSTDQGIQLAVEEINAGGGVLGKPLKVISEDDQGNQDEAVTVVKKLINRDHVVAVLGEVASTNSLAGGGVCQNAHIPMISPSSTNPSVTKGKDFVFRVCFTDDFQGSADATFGIKKGWKNVAVFTAVDSDYSKGLSHFFKADFAKQGKVVADEEYRKSDRDFKPQLSRIKAATPDAVYLPGYYEQVVQILRQARELGLNVPFFGGDGWDSDITLKTPEANGCYFSNHYSPDEQRPAVQAFVKAFKAKWNAVPDAMAVTGYDAARVLAEAIQRAGKTDPRAIRDAIALTHDFHGASGAISIDSERNARKPLVFLLIQDGKTTIADTISP